MAKKKTAKAKAADPVKEPIKAEPVAATKSKHKDPDIVEFVGNGTHQDLPARKPRKLEYATAKVLVAKGYGYIRED